MNDKADQKDHRSTSILYFADDTFSDNDLKIKTVYSRVKDEDKEKYKDKELKDICILENYIQVFNFGNKLLKYSEDILRNIEEEEKISALLMQDKDFIECKNKCENINTIMICIHGHLEDVDSAWFDENKTKKEYKIQLIVLVFFIHHLIGYRSEINIILSMCYAGRTEDYKLDHSDLSKISEGMLKTSFAYKFSTMFLDLAIKKSLSHAMFDFFHSKERLLTKN